MTVPPTPGSPSGDPHQVPPGKYAPPPPAGPPPAPGAHPQQPMYVTPVSPPYYYVPPRRTNGLAVASLVLGILWLYWVGSILALVFGYVARQQIREREESGDGLAIAGIVLGWVGVSGLLFWLVVIEMLIASVS